MKAFKRGNGLERFAKSAEDFRVFAAVFLRQDHDCCGRQAMPKTVHAAAPLTAVGFSVRPDGRCGGLLPVVLLMAWCFIRKVA
jgi:hypothetical protein